MQDSHEDRRVDEPGFPSDTRRRLGPWLRALAGICLAAAMACGAAMVTGGGTASAHTLISNPAPSGPCSPASPNVAVRVPAPTYCLMAQPDDTKVKLTWDHAAGKSFFVYYGTAQDILKATKFVDATGMDVTVTGLINGTKYYFWLVAGKFPNVVSNMASATPVTVPEAPTGLTATPGNSQVTLSWAAPASDGGSPVSRYNVFEGTAADLSSSAPVTNVTGTAVTLPGLINGTTYYFRVTAVNRAGEGQPSNEVQAVPVTVPGAPTGLTVTAGNAQVTLSWTAPASDGGSQISGYVIYKGTSPGGETSTPVSGSLVTATSYTVTGLANGITYYFTVTAVNRIGDSPASNEVSAVPVTVPGAPTGLTATRGNAQATLSWTAPASDDGSQITGYDLYVGTTADLSANAPVARVTGTVVTVTGLVNGTTYYFTVTAVNRIGDGPASNEVRAVPETVPGAPTGLTATPGNARATLSWAAPPTGGAAISGYLIYQGTSPNGETRTPVNGLLVNAISYTVTGLTNGTTYYFRVVAVNAAGQGLSSAEAPATLRPIVPTSPPPTTPTSSTTTSSTTPRTPAGTKPSGFGAPTGLTATPGDARVHLSWARARVGWRLGHQLQGLFRQPSGRAGERRDRHRQEHRRHRGRSGRRHHLLLHGGRGRRQRE